MDSGGSSVSLAIDRLVKSAVKSYRSQICGSQHAPQCPSAKAAAEERLKAHCRRQRRLCFSYSEVPSVALKMSAPPGGKIVAVKITNEPICASTMQKRSQDKIVFRQQAGLTDLRTS